MIKEKIIGILVCIFSLLLACSEPDENDSLINRNIMGKDKVNVSLSLSLPEMQLEGNTDYRPMSSRAAGNIRSIIANSYKCLVIKEIGDKWYVDTLTQRKLTTAGTYAQVSITDDTRFNDLQLTLRPGHYRVLVVLNPRSTVWNPNLIPGAIVKGAADTIAHAYTYSYQTDPFYANIGKREVRYEVFAGTAEFTVEKTSGLHSNPVNGNTHIAFARKVAQLRFLLKDEESKENKFNFVTTQHTVYATLKATQTENPFCDGLDCWGDAYYNHRTPTTEIEICTNIDPNWRVAKTGIQYKMISGHVTIYSPFVFTDDTRQVDYQLEAFKIAGQSGQGGFTYVYSQPIYGLKLKNNAIRQFVFRTTDEVDPDAAYPQLQVGLEYLEDESNQDLFDSDYECNIP